MTRPSALAGFAIMAFFGCISGALAETVTPSGAPVYVTKNDCTALVQHRPAAGVAYEPGVDVHGKYVPSATMGSNQSMAVLPDRIEFDLKINPMNYTQRNDAQRQITGSSKAIANNANSLQAAQTARPGLQTNQAGLQSQQAALAARKAAIDANFANESAHIIATTGGDHPTDLQTADRQRLIDTLVQGTTGSASYQQITAAQSANGQALASAGGALNANQHTIDADTAQAPGLQNQLTTAQGNLAESQGRPFANTALAIGRIAVDLRTGQTSFNGQPLGSEQEQMVANACRKAGF